MELASSSVLPPRDMRPRLPEPPPVRLVTVADARLAAAAGFETQLDAFYVDLLRFEREAQAEYPIYRAENFRLVFDVIEPPVERLDFRALGIQTQSLRWVESKLIDAEIEYVRQKGLAPGIESLLLLDPAGNWIELTETRAIR